MIMSNCRAIQNEGRQNLFRFVLQSEAAALSVVRAARRTLLGDDEAVLSRNRRIGSHDSFKPEEINFRLSANHTFYCDGRYWHLIGSGSSSNRRTAWQFLIRSLVPLRHEPGEYGFVFALF